jgi:DNA-directed RNA polymerase specialized sigma24 family protein
MKYFTELTYEEIGVLLAVPANTVKDALPPRPREAHRTPEQHAAA